MTDRDPALAGYDALIGAWDTEATHPLFDGVVTGEVAFEWLEGGHYLIQRSIQHHEMFPDGMTVTGRPEEGDGLLAEYFDSRGVRRTYGTSFEDGVWKMWRDQPGFDQRMTAQVEPDGFVLQAELAEAPGEWRDDLRMVYRRRG